MKKWLIALTFLLFASSGFSQNLTAQMADILVYIDLGPSDNYRPFRAPWGTAFPRVDYTRTQVENAARIALNLWQSTVPGFHYRIVSARNQANLLFRYRHEYTGVYFGVSSATALSFQPQDWNPAPDFTCGETLSGAANINPAVAHAAFTSTGAPCREDRNNIVSFLTSGKNALYDPFLSGGQGHATAQHIFGDDRLHYRNAAGDCVTGASDRNAIWTDACIVEATWNSTPDLDAHTIDMAMEMNHEFGHCLLGNIVHLGPNSNNYVNFNANPVLNPSDFYTLPYAVMSVGTHAAARAVFNRDAYALRANGYRIDFPLSQGLIRMGRRNGTIFTTSSWETALNRMLWPRQTIGTPNGDPNQWFFLDAYPLSSARLLAAGSSTHTLALENNGMVLTWGDNITGQLGTGPTPATRNAPAPVSTDNSGATLPPLIGVSTMNCHDLALAQDGIIYAWGCNESGRLGDGSITDRNRPVRVCPSSGDDCFNNRYSTVAAGGDHSLAIRDDGTLWAWGGNGFGELGLGPITGPRVPTQVDTDNDWVAIAAGATHSLGLKADGRVFAWGRDNVGQLGDANLNTEYTPQPIASLTGIRAIAAGWDHNLAIRADGSLVTWGWNQDGQAGQTVFNTFRTPGNVSNAFTPNSQWISVAGGYCHSVGVKSNGTIWTWGCNDGGQLGNNAAFVSSGAPDRVCDANTGCTTNRRYTAVEAGGGHTLAIGATDGRLYAWGDNAKGQLGDNTTTGRDFANASLHTIPGLAGSLVTTPGTRVLTDLGLVDWMHWGLTTTTRNRKRGVDLRLGEMTRIGTGTASQTPTGSVTYSWNNGDGDPNTMGSTTRGIQVSATNNGFRFTAPANTGMNVLRVYVGVSNASGRMTASISDASSTDYQNTLTNSGTVNREYTIRYSSGSPGRTVTVSWTKTSGSGSVRLYAAGLN